MGSSSGDHETKALLDELEKKVKDLSSRNRASMNVVRTLGTYLRDGGSIPRDLALAIGGCLMDYVGEDGACTDPDIQLLHDEVVRVLGW